MAQTMTSVSQVMRGYAPRAFAGKQLRIPIRLAPEARARRDWNAAVTWLEAREAARVEWPWPER
jgi:hypothetical protein